MTLLPWSFTLSWIVLHAHAYESCTKWKFHGNNSIKAGMCTSNASQIERVILHMFGLIWILRKMRYVAERNSFMYRIKKICCNIRSFLRTTYVMTCSLWYGEGIVMIWYEKVDWWTRSSCLLGRYKYDRTLDHWCHKILKTSFYHN